jgi:hypothetical protein
VCAAPGDCAVSGFPTCGGSCPAGQGCFPYEVIVGGSTFPACGCADPAAACGGGLPCAGIACAAGLVCGVDSMQGCLGCAAP